jgi:hypothetical protein
VARGAPTGTAPTPERRRDLVAGLPLVPLGAIAVTMAAVEGGFSLTVWLPAALSLLALGCVLAVAAPARLRGPLGPAGVAVVLLAALTAWLFLSMLWAEDPAAAWEGANRALLYTLVFALPARWGVTPGAAWVGVLALGAAIAAVAVVTVTRVLVVDEPLDLFISGRLSSPTGYPNANAALWCLAAWPLVALASLRWLGVLARAAALGLAVLLWDVSLLSQSRGSIYTLPVVALAALLVARGRLRLLVTLTLAAAAALPAVRPVLEAYEPGREAALRDEMGTAAWAIALSAGLAFALGAALALVDRRVELGRRARLAGWTAAALVAVVGAVTIVATASPVDRTRGAWDSFRHGGEPAGAPSRFHGFGSNRYDFWRVGLGEFRESPLHGIGADNFAVPYLEQRRSGEEPLYAHSVAVDLLSQAGVVGFALALAFGAAALWAVLTTRGRSGDVARVAVAGWFVLVFHGAVDWLWEVPANGVLGVGLLGVAVGLSRHEAAVSEQPRPVSRARAALTAAAAALVVAAAAASLALPWLAQRSVDEALRTWRRDPGAALAALDRARRLNPLTDRPDVLGGAIASRLGRWRLMEARYERAVERAPFDWYAQLGLAVAASRTGRFGVAREAAARARALKRGDPVVADVLRDVTAGRPVNAAAVDEAFVETDADG